MHDEHNWITLAKSGNQKAFRVLYDEHVTPLYRFLKQFSQRDGEVHEWVQRAFIKAFEHLGSFDERSKFSSWLFRLAINEMKMDRRHEQIVPFESLDKLTDLIEPDGPSFEWHHTMKSWMGELDKTKRMVFILYEVEGYSHAEIASTLGIAESSSRTFLTGKADIAGPMEQGDQTMIKPKDFYSSGDSPGKGTISGMWRRIQSQATPMQSVPWFVRDRRSFFYGMAATVVLGLAFVGAWTLARQAFEDAQPQPLRLEQAYVSAIKEFEHVLPFVTAKFSQTPQTKEELTQRVRQLSLVDAAISELRLQTNGTDLSPLKRERLRQLYAIKLQILQQMIEKGEIEL